MAAYEMTVNRAHGSARLTHDKGWPGGVATVLHHVLEAQVPAHSGARPDERRADRQA
jgi:hypothetical protein